MAVNVERDKLKQQVLRIMQAQHALWKYNGADPQERVAAQFVETIIALAATSRNPKRAVNLGLAMLRNWSDKDDAFAE